MTNTSLEKKFQLKLIKELKRRFPECVIIKTDPGDIQGISDLLILWGPRWAMLEVKRSANASHRPNQDYYVELFDTMSFDRFIYPENKEEVLDELARSWST